MEREELQARIRNFLETNDDCQRLLSILADNRYRLELNINPEGVDRVQVTKRYGIDAAGVCLTMEDGREEVFVRPRTARDAFLFVVNYLGIARSHELLPRMVVAERPDGNPNLYREVTDENGIVWFVRLNHGTRDLVAAINRAFRNANLNCRAELG